MDIDCASMAMDMLRAATEQNEVTAAELLTNTNKFCANPHQLPLPSDYVSQFRIDGQPILPPLMTTEKRREMQQLRQLAIELESKYKRAPADRSTASLEDGEAVSSDNISGSTSSSNGNNSSDCSDNSMINTQRKPQLQQTETFIYDSTRQQRLEEPPCSPRSRPQTLEIERLSVASVIPTICVNPPTPMCEQLGAESTPSSAPSCDLAFATQHRKLNNITCRILQFEHKSINKEMPQQAQSMKLLWQNDALVSGDKRMHRSSTSPLLNADPMDTTQLHRSRSFTLEQPSQALIEHMHREGQKPQTPTPSISSPSPSLPTAAPHLLPAHPTSSVQSLQRCHYVAMPVSRCASAQSLAHLRRDTIESKAKKVHSRPDSASSSSCLDTVSSPGLQGRQRGGNSVKLQQQKLQLDQLLQKVLHEKSGIMEEQERIKLASAKHKMFEDIRSAHHQRFYQLIQYQHEEQRRLQEEFDRQQKVLIEQICAEINVSSYAHSPRPNGVSEYTMTDDLTTPQSQSSPQPPSSVLDDKSGKSAARKRLFDTENDSEDQIKLLPLQSAASSPRSLRSNKINNRIRKPVQRSPPKSPTVKKATTMPTTTATTATAPKRDQQKVQQQTTLSKTRRSASPNRQTRFVAKK